MPLRSVPGTASVAQSDAKGRLYAPAAARNSQPLCDAVAAALPPKATRALEIASGTGQHVVALAAALPDIRWQPSDVDPARLSSIRAYVERYQTETAAKNITPPVAIDAVHAGWGAVHTGQDLVLVVNLLHLISTAEVETLIHEAAHCLAPSGRLMIYGPFRRNGALTSAGDQQFDASLRAHDPDIGYKDVADIDALCRGGGLTLCEVVEMPANNLLLLAERAPKQSG